MICRAVESDLPEILRLQRLAFTEEAEHCGDLAIDPMVETLERLRADLEEGIVLKFVAEGRIVGAVRSREREGGCYISRLVVHPDMRGRGIGRRLMEAIEGENPNAPRFQLFTREDNLRNRRLYDSLGYRPVRVERVSDILSFVHLEKDR